MHFLQEYVIEELNWQPSKLKYAYEELQKDYRSKQKIGYSNLDQVQSYVFTRFPATYSVCLKLIKQYFSTISINSILDWGCGIGTASLAIGHLFEKMEYYLIEQDEFAKNYAAQFLKYFFPNNAVIFDMPKAVDLSVFSYSLGEVESWQIILDQIWEKTNYLLIIEPGTTLHFQRLLQVRDYMLSKNAYLWGPCCHNDTCPIVKNDWCHFGLNIERSKAHRLLKGASRSFEQEAYSYLLFAKTSIVPDLGRVIANPRTHGGHVDLKICGKNGKIFNKTVSRSMCDYKILKKIQWGDNLKDEFSEESK